MTKFKVGDYVTIRKDLKHGTQRSKLFVNDDMILAGGVKFKIYSIISKGMDGQFRGTIYRLYNSPWTWTEDLFEEYKKAS